MSEIVRRPVPTHICDGKAWVEAHHYDQARTDLDYAENAYRERDHAVAENERLRYVLRVAHAHWDADRDVKVGKALVLGLRGEPVPSAPEVPAPTKTPKGD